MDVLISDAVLNELNAPGDFAIRKIDRVKPRGRKETVDIYEVFNGASPLLFDKKLATKRDFETGIRLYRERRLEDAMACFGTCLERYPEDKAATLYHERCGHYLKVGWDENWDGIEGG